MMIWKINGQFNGSSKMITSNILLLTSQSVLTEIPYGDLIPCNDHRKIHWSSYNLFDITIVEIDPQLFNAERFVDDYYCYNLVDINVGYDFIEDVHPVIMEWFGDQLFVNDEPFIEFILRVTGITKFAFEVIEDNIDSSKSRHEIIRRMLNRGLNANSYCQGARLLNISIINKRWDIVGLLYQNHADDTLVDNNGISARDIINDCGNLILLSMLNRLSKKSILRGSA